jgi:heme-degrading monooxygenase HmoA
MYARVVTGTVQPGKLDELSAIFRDDIVPAAEQETGFEGGFLLTDAATSKFVSISLWATKADMEAGDASGYLQEQTAKIAPTLAAPTVKEVFAVGIRA